MATPEKKTDKNPDNRTKIIFLPIYNPSLLFFTLFFVTRAFPPEITENSPLLLRFHPETPSPLAGEGRGEGE
jgi:hypothetical protein